MKVCSMSYSMRMKCNSERFSSLIHVASISHKISGLHFLIFLRIHLSRLVGIYYTSLHLNMYILSRAARRMLVQRKLISKPEMYKSREERCEHLRNVLRAKDDEDHTLCMEELPKLPEWKPRRRGRKRGRSKSSGRASKRRVVEIQAQDQGKEIQISAPGPVEIQAQDNGETGDLQVQDQGKEVQISAPGPIEYEETRSIQVVDQPRIGDEGIDDEVVMIEDENDVDHDLERINDPKPSCRKTVSEKKKKKRKGKRKGPIVKRTYDEIIEAEICRDSDDCDLEVYFSGDLI